MEIQEELLLNSEEVCPVCESREYSEQFCKNCNFDFSEAFTCPITDDKVLNESNKKICAVDKTECKVKGLQYESCDKYHKYNR